MVTWDADATPDARDFFVNQATPQGIGYTLMDNAASVLGGKGEFAIITASLTAANMIEWQRQSKQRRREISRHEAGRHRALRRQAADTPSTKTNDDPERPPERETHHGDLLARRPGAAEAVKQSGRKGRESDRPGTPQRQQALRARRHHRRHHPLEHHGPRLSHRAWPPNDFKDGTLKPGDTTITAGRLGKLEIQGDNILLGKPFKFTKDNIDQFDF